MDRGRGKAAGITKTVCLPQAYLFPMRIEHPCYGIIFSRIDLTKAEANIS